jgi:hypothetical protein
MTPVLAYSATYYVNKTGNNSNSCAQAQVSATAKQTIAGGISCMSAGDKLIIGDGTYAERITNTVPSGTAGAPTTIQAANRNAAILRPSGSGYVVNIYSGKSYITFDGLDVDAVNENAGLGQDSGGYWIQAGTHNIIIKNGTAQNARQGSYAGIILESTNGQVLNMDILNNGLYPSATATTDHGIYVKGSNNVIDGNRISGSSGYCIHQYANDGMSPNNNVYKNNICTGSKTRGVILSTGSGAVFFNNVVYNNAWGVEVSGPNTAVYNNTIYNNGYNSSGIGQQCVVLDGGSGQIIRNNICHQNKVNSIVNSSASSFTASNNLFVNPSFVDAVRADFQLNSGSAAIDAAMAIPQVTNDLAGTLRPQGNGPDIGAFERPSGQATTGRIAPPTNVRLVIN